MNPSKRQGQASAATGRQAYDRPMKLDSISRRRAAIGATVRRHWTPRATPSAVVLIAIAGAWLFAWWHWDVEVLDAWMPNIVTGLIVIAVTITFVDWIIRHEARARVGPRVDRTLSELGASFQWFVMQVEMDYVMTHVRMEYEMTGDALEILRRWVDDPPDDPDRGRGTARLVLEQGREFANLAKRLADADRVDLPPELVAAIDNLQFSLGKAESVPPLPEKARPGLERWTRLVLVQGIRAVGIALQPHVAESVFVLHRETATIPAVPPEQ